MLKKSDLAKQFELLTQQEIKNYNDNLNNVLDSIRQLKEEIREVHQESLENHAMIHSIQGTIAIEVEHLKDACKKMAEHFDRTFNDQRVLNERNSADFQDLINVYTHQITRENQIDEKLKDLSKHVVRLESDSLDNQKILNDNLDDILRRFRQEILKTKKEIMDAPTEASLVRRELEEKIALHKVDVSGIMRELRIYKHDNMVTSKKIENIYTLIERLKKSEG